MRGTGRESFAESTRGRHPNDGDDNENIGSQDYQEAGGLVECGNDEAYQLAEGGIRTG